MPYSAVTAIPARKALVLAPHPDDEIFGCGGAIAAHVAQGVPVDVVILTDGALFADAAIREKESRAAAALLGYGEPEFWGLPDRELICNEALVERVAQKIRSSSADLVYAPSPQEIHPDHCQLAMTALQAIRRVAGDLRIAQYEVGVPLRWPNLLLDISARLELKQQAMRCFASQLERQPYDRQIAALNCYRTYTLTEEVTAAEAYRVMPAADLEPGGDAESVAPGACGRDEAARREIESTRQRLDAVLNSRSWKLTEPLRRLARLLRGD